MATWTAERSRLARTVRDYGLDHPITADARRDFRAARLEHQIRQVLATTPPLTREQADFLASLLRPAGGAA